MCFASAKFRDHEMEVLLLPGQGIVCGLQFLGFPREFSIQIAQGRIGRPKTVVGRK